MVALLIANTAVTISEFAGIASGLALFGIPKTVSVPLMGLLIWLLTMSGSFRRIEKILPLGAALRDLCGRCVFGWPQLGRGGAFHGDAASVSPSRATSAASSLTIGTTIAPWIFPGAEQRQVDKTRTSPISSCSASTPPPVPSLPAPSHGSSSSTTGAVLYPPASRSPTPPTPLLALEPIAGEFATVLFAAGLVAASFLAACVLPGVTSSAVCEAFGWERGADRSWNEAPVYRGIITVIIVASAALVIMPGVDLFQIMMSAQVINGVLLPILLVFLVFIASDKHIMGRFKNSRLWNVLTWATIVLITVLTVVMFVLQALGY